MPMAQTVAPPPRAIVGHRLIARESTGLTPC